MTYLKVHINALCSFEPGLVAVDGSGMGQQCNGYLKVETTTTKMILCEMVWDNNATDILRLKRQQQRRSCVKWYGTTMQLISSG